MQTIFQAIIDRLASDIAATKFIEESATPPKVVAIYNRQYEDEGESEPLPERPCLLVEFEAFDWVYKAGRKEADVPVILHILNDVRVEGHNTDTDQLATFMDILKYPEVIEDIINGYVDANLDTPFRHQRTVPNHEYKGTMVVRSHFMVRLRKNDTFIES